MLSRRSMLVSSASIAAGLSVGGAARSQEANGGPPPPPANAVLVGAIAVTQVFGGGQRLVAVAVEGGASDHRGTWRIAYGIEGLRDWLLRQKSGQGVRSARKPLKTLP
jgi:hypothetical protein